MNNIKIHFVISPAQYAQDFGKSCIQMWGQTHILQASYVVSIGGDGAALVAEQEALSAYLLTGKILPVYSVDCSNAKEHIGALTNRRVKKAEDIKESILEAKEKEVFPLQADCELLNAENYHTYYGFNEVTVKVLGYEMTYLDVNFSSNKEQTVKGDGFILATPMGKRGYYYNLNGKDFKDNELGFQTIAARDNVNLVLPENEKVSVKVLSRHRPTAIMRDCNLISEPIIKASIHKSNIPMIILKDRQRT